MGRKRERERTDIRDGYRWIDQTTNKLLDEFSLARLSTLKVGDVECYASRPCVCLGLRHLVRILRDSESHTCDSVLECSPGFVRLCACWIIRTSL